MSGERFETIVPYWPARSGCYWWEGGADELGRDLDAAQEAALAHLDLNLLWSAFQPERLRVAVPPMRLLETMLEAAWDRPIRVRLRFFDVVLGGVLLLPSWVLEPGTRGAHPVLAGHHLTTQRPYNPFSDPQVVEAEELLTREVVSSFADHPAISSWVLGSRLERLAPPEGPGEFEEWLGSLVDTVRHAGGRQPIAYGISARELITASWISRQALGPDCLLEVTADWKPAWGTMPEADWAGYLAAYGCAVTGMPVHVAGVGWSTREEGYPGSGCEEEGRVAERSNRALGVVHESGGGGASPLSLLDLDADLRRVVPYNHDPRLLTAGLLTAGAVPKETLQPWAEWSAACRSIAPALMIPAPDPEARRVAAEDMAREFYEMYAR